MRGSKAFPETAEIIDILKDDPAVDKERVERATVIDRAEGRVDFVSEVTLEVTKQTDRRTFPQSGYEYLCRQRVPYSERYDYAPEDFSEQTIEFVETGCQPQRCGDCDGNGQMVCLDCGEGVIEEFSHRDHGTARIVSAFVVGDCDDETQTQRDEDLRSCVDAASGERTPEAAVLY